MTTTKITSDEITRNAVESLPTRPTEAAGFGGRGYTSLEMKAAFDRLPRLIAQRFNYLITDIEEGDILSAIPTEIDEMPTLYDLLSGIEDEKLASAIKVFGISLKTYLYALREDLDAVMAALNMSGETAE